MQVRRGTYIPYFKTTTLVLDLSRIFLEFFIKPVYPTIVAKKFQIHGVKITGKYICESN